MARSRCVHCIYPQSEASSVCNMLAHGRTKTDDNFLKEPFECCVVCVFFFFLSVCIYPSPMHCPPPETKSRRIKVALLFLLLLLCTTDPSQREAAEAVDHRSLEEILGSIPPPPPPAMTNEPGAPRLMITHLVNRNFKSYAGEQILGPFHKVRHGLPGDDFCWEEIRFRSLWLCAFTLLCLCLMHSYCVHPDFCTSVD